jgi:multisubunit Na+/H+ antiporter MnhF subunit
MRRASWLGRAAAAVASYNFLPSSHTLSLSLSLSLSLATLARRHAGPTLKKKDVAVQSFYVAALFITCILNVWAHALTFFFFLYIERYTRCTCCTWTIRDVIEHTFLTRFHRLATKFIIQYFTNFVRFFFYFIGQPFNQVPVRQSCFWTITYLTSHVSQTFSLIFLYLTYLTSHVSQTKNL